VGYPRSLEKGNPRIHGGSAAARIRDLRRDRLALLDGRSMGWLIEFSKLGKRTGCYTAVTAWKDRTVIRTNGTREKYNLWVELRRWRRPSQSC
jgi:hypothetical protein